MLDAALNHMVVHGRIVMCGLIEQYNGQSEASGPRNLSQVIRKRLTMQGLIVFDHWQHYGEFLAEVTPAFDAGTLQAEETVYQGSPACRRPSSGCSRGSIPARCWSSWRDPQHWRLTPQTACMTGPSALRWAVFMVQSAACAGAAHGFPACLASSQQGALLMSTPIPTSAVDDRVILTNPLPLSKELFLCLLLSPRRCRRDPHQPPGPGAAWQAQGQPRPYWSIAGGHLELGETFESAAIREVAEETGFQISNSSVIAVTNNLETWRESGLHYVSVTLLAEVEGEPQLLEPEVRRLGLVRSAQSARAPLRCQPPVHRLLAGESLLPADLEPAGPISHRLLAGRCYLPTPNQPTP